MSGLDALLVLALAATTFVAAGPAAATLGIWGVAILQIAAFAVPALLVGSFYTRPRAVLSLRRVSGVQIAAATLLGSSAWVWVYLWTHPLAARWASEGELERLEAALDVQSHSAPALLLCLALTPALCEELLHRGVLLPTLRAKLGRNASVIASASLFAASHLSLARFAPTFVVGLLCAAAATRTRSIWPAAAIHCCYNAGLLVGGAVLSAWWVAIPAALISILASLLFWNQEHKPER
jgi:sodium transport system permease protein